MASRTPQEIGRSNLARSKEDERKVAGYFRSTGLFPLAERAVRTGFKAVGERGADPGDITNTPGLVTSVKSYTDVALVERFVPGWLEELERMQWLDHSIRILVVRRYGKTDPGDWWCFMRLGQLLPLIDPDRVTCTRRTETVRMLLRDVVPLIADSGVGWRAA